MVTGNQLKILEGLLEVFERRKDELAKYKKDFKKRLKGEQHNFKKHSETISYNYADMLHESYGFIQSLLIANALLTERTNVLLDIVEQLQEVKSNTNTLNKIQTSRQEYDKLFRKYAKVMGDFQSLR